MKLSKGNFAFLSLIALAILFIAVPASHLYAQSPTLTVDPQSLSFGEVEIGEEAVLAYTLSGSDLIANVMLHVSGGFLISQSENSGFQQHLILQPTDGYLTETIYVKFVPQMPRVYNGRVRNRTIGVPDQMVALNGIGILDLEDTPQLTATPDSLYFGELMIGEEMVLSYNLTGENLISNVFITAARGYLISMTEDAGFQPQLVLEPVEGTVSQNIYVKFRPLLPRMYAGRICNRAIGATNEIIRVVGAGIFDPLFPPQLTVDPDSLYFGEVPVEEEMVLSYNLTGENLVSNVHLRAPRGYLISTEEHNGFQQMIVLEPVDGLINETIYVKFLPLYPRNYFGVVRNMTIGAMRTPVRVRGIGVIGDPDHQIRKAVRLHGNYPNPFNPETTIGFSLGESGFVNLEIFNSRGQKVKTLVNDYLREGEHTVVWNGRDDANRVTGSGIYFYRIKQGKYTSTGKMILMK